MSSLFRTTTIRRKISSSFSRSLGSLPTLKWLDLNETSTIRCITSFHAPHVFRELRRTFSRVENSDNLHHIRLSTSSLGLVSEMALPFLSSIRQLPEVESVLNDTEGCSSTVIENLNRAVQVFETMNKGGMEHCTVLALLAELQQRAGRYREASKTLDTLCKLTTAPTTSMLPIAQAKALWYGGNYKNAFEKCEQVANEDYCPALLQSCALNGMGVSSLLMLPGDDIHEADTTRELLRVGCKTAENAFRETTLSTELGLAAAGCYTNLGVAQLVYSEILSSKVPDVPVPRDPALQAWRNGLNLLDEIESFPNVSRRQGALSELMSARLHANMAFAILDGDFDERLLSTASEFARQALSIYEKHKEGLSNVELRACLGRALTLVARCYVEADSAVTAEGLFQTALESLGNRVSPLEKLDLLYAYEGYASLCHNWDKRESDANRLEQESKNVIESLPESWRRKSGIHSGIWFFTPSDFS